MRKRIELRNPLIAIAGQTAPGGGICLRIDPETADGGPLKVMTSEVIIRHMRFRPGPPKQARFAKNVDGLTIANREKPIRNVIIDHCSFSWSGSYKERIWVVNRDGSGNRHVYQRKPLGKPDQFEWIVHETWNTDRARPREIITANWPRGCLGIDIDRGAARPVCSFNAWHPSINRQGTQMCTDTNFPDIGLQLFDPRDGIGVPLPLCFPEASSEGKHWNTDHCPYDDEDYKQGKWKVYAPQHTHPHPAFSPDGRFVVFTSDRTGQSQVYEAEIHNQNQEKAS